MTNKRGGRRPGAGRKPRKDGRKTRVVKVALTDEEFTAIKGLLNTDSRRDALMKAIEQMAACPSCGLARKGEESGKDERG